MNDDSTQTHLPLTTTKTAQALATENN